MVNRIINLAGSVSANATDEEQDSFSPSSGETITTRGIYTNEQTAARYTIELNETRHADNIDGEDTPNAEDPLPFEVRLEEGDELKFLATDESGGAQDVALYVLAEDSGKRGA